jgi:mRNA-degrading endonuclease toxin of MazEF toxin-antitoxin module
LINRSDLILDPALPEFASARLTVASALRLHKLATIHTTNLQRYIGTVSATISQHIDARLHILLDL